MWFFIDEYGFDVDYYKEPLQRMTLLHVIAKFHLHRFTEKEEELIRRLI
jgi:hypothetical protein